MATQPQGIAPKSRFGPSERLITMLRSCPGDPTEAIKARLKRMLQVFYLHHCGNVENEAKEKSFKGCCVAAAAWYYKILENLVSQERRRLGVSVISGIVGVDLIQCCLVACCLEISICSRRLQCDFPLLLQILNVAPYHFWRVIELVLRADAGLPRAIVSHLAQVEDKVLESLAWTSNSPLWEEIRANEGRLPTCQQVGKSTQKLQTWHQGVI
ncbi:hypothetical protein INR49_020268 [Caranx melampygus]|nr:hypothetical protein INR49_020268 [Caranx melampygus]